MTRKIVDLLANIFAFIYSVKLARLFKRTIDIIYTQIIVKTLLSVGKNPLFMRSVKIYGGKNIVIGDNFYCYWGVRIETYSIHNNVKFQPKITIGNNVSFNPDCHIAAILNIEIQDGVLFASRVFVTDHFHGDSSLSSLKIPPHERLLISKGKVIIKENAWLGEGVAVMPGVTIGKNSIIGANSVVTKDIPDYAIAVGVPAKVIKQYNID